MSGKVFLVGAGPGDPELLTRKAGRLLGSTDAVLHDDLVSAEILQLISNKALVTNVGKRCGSKNIRQEEINFLMITLAAAGLQVIRLKSGDPLMFGRGGEEMEALRKAGVDFEIVPGVTSALGAAAIAEIPLTDRRASSAVIFVTGHQAPEKGDADWRALVNGGATLVVYMPGAKHDKVAGRLRVAGLSGDTPCAIISRASTADQRVYHTTVQELEFAPVLAGPTLLIVGEVVRFGKAVMKQVYPAWRTETTQEHAAVAGTV